MKYIIFSMVVVAVMVVGVGSSAVTAHAMNKAELVEAMASHAGVCGKIDTIDNAPEEKERGIRETPNGDKVMRILKKKLPGVLGGDDNGGNAPLPEERNGDELNDAIASERCLSNADAKKALEGFLSAATDALKNGDRLSLIGFGSFSVSRRAERNRDVAEVIFSPEVQSKGAEKRHSGETLTGEEIVKTLSDKCGEGESCPAYEKMLNALISVSSDALARGEFVEWGTEEWGDFGTLQSAMATSISKRSARTGRNPQTGKEIQIAAKNTVKFKAGAELSKAVN